MPEAPEVQTVLDTLKNQIENLQIRSVDVRYPKIVHSPDVQTFSKELTGQHFRQFIRLGKYLIFRMDSKDLIVHLRMEGKFYLLDEPVRDKHIHVVFGLSDGRSMCYHDTRKFGRMDLYDREEDFTKYPCFKNVGYDILDERADAKYLYKHLHAVRRPLKACLLDQNIVAGIGNIYADEICFAAKLDPRSRSYRISKKDCENLIFHARRIMKGAMKAGGTTIRSYTSSLGVTGLFQLELKVHACKDQPCPVCQTPIKKITVTQRGTYLCPKCQIRK